MFTKIYHVLGDEIARHSTFKQTCKHLGHLNSRQLEDIGLHYGSVRSIAMEAADSVVASRRAARSAKETQAARYETAVA